MDQMPLSLSAAGKIHGEYTCQSRINAFATEKERLSTAFPSISYINVFLLGEYKNFPLLSSGIIFRFSLSSLFAGLCLVVLMNVPWWQAVERGRRKKSETNQNVEKGVKYDNSVDSLSLVSLILISHHKFVILARYVLRCRVYGNLFRLAQTEEELSQ